MTDSTGGQLEAQILVVTDPPHRELDLAVVADLLDVALEEARLKMSYTAPEVMLAWDPERASAFARSLAEAGVNVAIVDGRELAEVPWPSLVTSFDFDGAGLSASVGDQVHEIGFNEPIVGVYCKPPIDLPPGWATASEGVADPADGPAVSRATEWMTLLDLYVERDRKPVRLSIARDLTDTSAVPGRTDQERMEELVEACRSRFRRLRLDTRLEDVRPRQRFVGGQEGFDLDMRKRYSFGTLLLHSVLDSISPELKDVTQYELGSRLAYVLNV